MFRTCPLSDHPHCLVPGQRSSRGWQAAKAQTGPDQALDAPMVLLNNVVQVFDLPQPGEAPQLTIALHGRDRSRIGRVLVDRDRAWVHRVRLAKCFAEEALGLVPGQRSSRGWQAAKAQTGPDQALDAPMVLLNNVVQVFDLPQP